jgi:CDP-diacylglycerol--glycerol-3-phosphate 3-phosphatidyltransferase
MLLVTYLGHKQLFTTLLVINLITDILDGYIARRFNMATSIGAKLDSIADICTYICAGAGLIKFEWNVVTEYSITIGLFAAIYLAGNIIALIKFGRIAALHLYIFKITGNLQGLFIIVLFCFGFYPWFFYLTAGLGIYACLEEIAVLFMLGAPRENAKGIYWLLKERANKSNLV